MPPPTTSSSSLLKAEVSPAGTPPLADGELELLAFALDHVREALYVVDYDFKIRHVNAEACRALGYSREMLTSMTVFDIDPDFTLDEARSMAANAECATGNSLILERRHRTRDGRVFPVEICTAFFKFGEHELVLSLARDITERKNAEHEQRLLNQALNASSEAAFLMDESGHFVYVNDAACRSLGYARTELIGMTPLDIDPDIQPEDFGALMKDVFSPPGIGEITESRHRTRDGRLFPVELSPCFLEEDGKKFRLVTVRDISARKRTEDTLRFMAQRGWAGEGKESFLTALARYLGKTLAVDYVIIGQLADEPGFVETAAVYAKGGIAPNMRYALLGTPCENVVGKTLCSYRDSIQTLFPDDSLLADMAADSYAGLPLWDSTGKPIGLIAVLDGGPLNDEEAISALLQLVAIRAAAELEQARHERLLRASEQKFRRLAEHLPDNIVRYDLNGRTTYVNPALEKTLGDAAAAMLGATVREYHANGGFEEYARAVDDVLADGIAREIEIGLPIPDGSPSPVHQIRIVPELDAHGAITGVLAIGHEVTQRKEAERQLIILNRAMNASTEAVFLMDARGRFIYVNDAACRSLGYSREELLTMSPVDIDPSLTNASLAAMLNDLLSTGPRKGVLESCHRSRNGRVFPVEIGGSAIEHEGHKYALAVARDISERKQAEQDRLEHLGFLENMDRVNRAIQEAGDVEQMMASALDAVREIFDCDRAFLLYPCDPDAASWDVPMECHKPEYPGVLAQGTALPQSDDIAQKLRILLETDKPVRFAPDGEHRLPPILAERFGIQSLMSIAVHPKSGAPWEFGIQQCSHARNWPPQEERLFQEISRRLADGLSILLTHRHLKNSQERLRETNEQLRELTMRRETAREEERKRIAREIHDELGQNLTALRMSISQLRFQHGAEYPFLASHIADMHQLVTGTLQTVRNISSSLHPAVLDSGIHAALSWLVNEFRRHSRIATRLDLPETEVALDEKRSLALFRIVQESLTNITRHSGATQVELSLARQDDGYTAEIRDNGRGFDILEKRTPSFGLVGMRERAYMADSEFTIASTPGGGTTVTVHFPVSSQKEAP